jgi:hypothetical protein
VARRVCGLENHVNEEAIAGVGLQRHLKKKDIDIYLHYVLLLLLVAL